MDFCANCAAPRNGNVRFCGSCGTEFGVSAAAPDEQAPHAAAWTPPMDATRADVPPESTRVEPPGAQGGQAAQPDPFASWYSPAQPPAPQPPRGGPDTYWQPTETVRPAPQPPGGYGAPPAPGGYPTAPAPMYGAPYPPGPAAGTPRGGGGGRRGLLAVLAIIVVLAAGGGAYALATTLGKQSGTGPSSPAASTSAAASASGATQPATGTSPASASAPASASPQASLVAIGPGVSGAAVPQVQQLLSKRFHAINTHDYAEYASTLTTREQAIQTRSKFDSGYASTSDSAMTLTALDQTSGGLAATVTFTSHQNPADSIDNSACNTWTVTYYLVPSGSGYLTDTAPAGAPAPAHADC